VSRKPKNPPAPPLPPAPAAPPLEDGRLAGPDPIACIDCGYDLRRLEPSAVCPECGAAVERSLGGDALGDSQPEWRRRIALGLQCISYAPALLLLVVVGMPIAAIAFSTAGIAPLAGQIADGLLQALLLGSVGLAIVGGILATVPEPRYRDLEAPRSPRRLARVGLGLVLATYVVFAVLDEVVGLPAPGPELAALTFALALGAFSFAFGRWLGSLLQRVPDLDLAQRVEMHGTFFGWAPAVIVGYQVVEPPVRRTIRAAPDHPIAWALGIATIFLGCFLFLVTLLAFIRTVTAWVALARAARAVRTAPSRQADPLAGPLPTSDRAASEIFPPPPTPPMPPSPPGPGSTA